MSARYAVDHDPAHITSPCDTFSAMIRATLSFASRFEISPDQAKDEIRGVFQCIIFYYF